jgi:hypothetical protein
VISRSGFVTLKVYDILRREVATLVNGNRQTDVHTVRFDASALSSGVYSYRLQAGSFSRARTMLLLKRNSKKSLPAISRKGTNGRNSHEDLRDLKFPIMKQRAEKDTYLRIWRPGSGSRKKK